MKKQSPEKKSKYTKRLPKVENEYAGKQLKKLMKSKGLHRKDLIEILHVASEQSITDYCSGRSEFDSSKQEVLINMYSLRPDYFESPEGETEKLRLQIEQLAPKYSARSTLTTLQLLKLIDPDFDETFPALTSQRIGAKINTQYQTELTPQLQMVDDFKALITELWSHVKEPLSNRSDLDFVMSCQLNQESKELETTFYQKHPQEPNSDYAMLYQLNKENLHYECFPYVKDSKDPTIKVETIETVTVPKEELQKHKGEETNFHPVSEETKSKDMEQ